MHVKTFEIENTYLFAIGMLFCLLFGGVGSVEGQSIWENEITGIGIVADENIPFTSGQIISPNISVSGIGIGSGISGISSNNRYNANSWNTISLDLTAYFYFTLTPNPTNNIDFVSFVYSGQTSGTGPTSFAFRSSVDGYTANIGTPTATGATIDLSGVTYQNITTPITFRLYAWGASGAPGTFSVNDFTFNGFVSNCVEPSTQASNLIFPTINTTDITLQVTRGDGDGGILVLARENNAVNSSPISGANYNANSAFGIGDEIGAGNFVVGKVTGSNPSGVITFPVAGLSSGTTYHFAIFEFNNAGICYKTPSLIGNTATSAISLGSDVIAIPNSEAGDILCTGGSVPNAISGTQVWEIQIRDGGVNAPDLDFLPTIVETITLAQAFGNAVNNWDDAISEIAIFNGNDRLATGLVTSNNITFSGNPLIVVADDASLTLQIRLTLKLNPNSLNQGNLDQDDFRFSLSNANFIVNPTGSGKASFAAAVSANDSNRIQIIGTQLSFISSPTLGIVNQFTTPSTVIGFTDAFGNVDRISQNIILSSTGSLQGGSVNVALVNGSATFTNLIFTSPQNGVTLNAIRTPQNDLSVNSTQFDVVQGTLLNPGDAFIIGLDNNVGGGADVYSILFLKPIVRGTSFILATTIFEPKTAAEERTMKFYSSNGDLNNNPPFIHFYYNGTNPLNTGAVFCFEINSFGNSLSNFSLNGNANLDFNFLPISTSFPININASSGNVNVSQGQREALFLLQGRLNFGTDANSDRFFTLDGNALSALQTSGSFIPFSLAGSIDGTDRTSRKHPQLECLSVAMSAGASEFHAYYNAAKTGTRLDILNNIRNYPGSYSISSSTTTNDITPVCGSGFTITDPTNNTIAWRGINTLPRNSDWFNCENWDKFVVPNDTTDVIIGNLPGVANCVIDKNSTLAKIYEFEASAKNLSLINKELVLQNNSRLNITGNLSISNISGVVKLLNSDTLEIKGNWNNNPIFSSILTEGFNPGSNSTVIFNGTNKQTISRTNNSTQIFRNLIIDKPTDSVVESLNGRSKIRVLGNLDLESGILSSDTNVIEIGENAVSRGSLTLGSGSIRGGVQRWFNSAVNSGNEGVFPISVKDTIFSTQTIFEALNRTAEINFTGAPTIGGSITTRFIDQKMRNNASGPIQVLPSSPNCSNSDTILLFSTENQGYWRIEAGNGLTGGTYSLSLTGEGFGNVTETDCRLTLVKRTDSTQQWELPPGSSFGINNNSNSIITVNRTGLTGFSDFGWIGSVENQLANLNLNLTGFAVNANTHQLEWELETSKEIGFYTLSYGHNTSSLKAIYRIPHINGQSNYQYLHQIENQANHVYLLRVYDVQNNFIAQKYIEIDAELGQKDFTLYPNPTKGQLFLSTNFSSPQPYEILDLQGRLVQKGLFVEGGITLITDLENGFYLIRIGQRTYKFALAR